MRRSGMSLDFIRGCEMGERVCFFFLESFLYGFDGRCFLCMSCMIYGTQLYTRFFSSDSAYMPRLLIGLLDCCISLSETIMRL